MKDIPHQRDVRYWLEHPCLPGTLCFVVFLSVWPSKSAEWNQKQQLEDRMVSIRVEVHFLSRLRHAEGGSTIYNLAEVVLNETRYAEEEENKRKWTDKSIFLPTENRKRKFVSLQKLRKGEL